MMKKTIMTSLILLSLIVLATCGGSGSSPDTPTDIPIAIEGIDGETGVSVSASFVYTFDTAPDSSTVTSDTFFIYPTNLTQADKVDATISASTDVEYILDPSADLEDDTLYGIVVRLTQITDAAGNPLGTVDVMIIFSTGDEAIPSFVGTLDTTFASPDGYITGSALGGFNNDYNIVLDSNENVYYMESYTDPKGFIIRKYDNQGNVDTTFASLGTLDQTGDGNRIRIMLIDNDFIFLVGKYEEDSVVIFKYNTDGIQVDSAS